MQMRRESIQRDGLCDRVNAHDFEIVDVRRNMRKVDTALILPWALGLGKDLFPLDDICRRTGSAERVIDLMIHLSARLCEVEPQFGAIFSRLSRRLIMHVEVNEGTRLDELSG